MGERGKDKRQFPKGRKIHEGECTCVPIEADCHVVDLCPTYRRLVRWQVRSACRRVFMSSLGAAEIGFFACVFSTKLAMVLTGYRRIA